MVYQKGYLVFEEAVSQIETYQMKSFYYQKIPGVRDFRVSMTSDRAFLYVPDEQETSFQKVAYSLSKDELIRFIHGMTLILERMEDYLLYEEHCLLRPEWIQCDMSKGTLDIEILYLPLLQEGEEEMSEECKVERDKKPLLTLLAECFNRHNEMEGFYYFMQVKENLKAVDGVEKCQSWHEILTEFAKNDKYKSKSCI